MRGQSTSLQITSSGNYKFQHCGFWNLLSQLAVVSRDREGTFNAIGSYRYLVGVLRRFCNAHTCRGRSDKQIQRGSHSHSGDRGPKTTARLDRPYRYRQRWCTGFKSPGSITARDAGRTGRFFENNCRARERKVAQSNHPRKMRLPSINHLSLWLGAWTPTPRIRTARSAVCRCNSPALFPM
jgi:hypothetical protein